MVKDDEPEALLHALAMVAAGGLVMSGALRPAVAPLALSERERGVLSGIAAGKTTQHIAQELRIGVRTVEAQRARLRTRLGLETRAELTAYARASGLLEGE